MLSDAMHQFSMQSRISLICLLGVLAGCGGDVTTDAAACRMEGMKLPEARDRDTYIGLCLTAKGYKFNPKPELLGLCMTRNALVEVCYEKPSIWTWLRDVNEATMPNKTKP